ncbi:MAG TPA: hypothetical protein DC046_15500 [Rhodospirillaceae bacterium]|nr:hypothetical protein [Rhodospirillaceae bacterium]
MAVIRLTPRAGRDLGEIWDYTANRWGMAQAETYLRSLQSALEFLAAEPERGQACDDIRPGYRRQPTGSHVIFYKMSETADGIDVIRILHQRMDVAQNL